MNKYLYFALFLIFCIQSAHSQNVGIGTETPRGKLEIAHNVYKQNPTLVLLDSGSIGWGPQILFQNVDALPNYWMLHTSVSTIGPLASFFNFNYNGTDMLTIRGDGQVGINKNNPDYALDVSGNSNVDGTFRINTTSSHTKPTLLLHDSSTLSKYALGPRIEFKNSNPSAESFKIQTILSTDLQDSYMDLTYDKEAIMTLSGDKKVGVNNILPQYTLDVDGDVNITDALLINGNAGTAGQVLTSTGSGAPEWKAPASTYIGPRFFARILMQLDANDPLITLDVVESSIYNSDPTEIAISESNDQIVVDKPGIYHFDIIGNVGPGVLYDNLAIYIDLYGTTPSAMPIRLYGENTPHWLYDYRFRYSFETYLDGSANSIYLNGQAAGDDGETASVKITVTGHWVRD